MKWLLCFLCALFVVSLSAKEKLPELSLDAEVSVVAVADEAYVLFLLESSGATMTEARNALNRKYEEASAKIKAAFPLAKEEVISVNIGSRETGSFRSSDTPMIPTIAKAFIYTIPADEEQAVKLLDLGMSAGLTPFCANVFYNQTLGAVLYGVSNPRKQLDALYVIAGEKLQNDAKAMARLLKDKMPGKTLKLNTIHRSDFREEKFEVEFRGYKIILPAAFCGNKKEQIEISLTLSGNFKWVD